MGCQWLAAWIEILNLVCSHNTIYFSLLALLTWHLPFEFFSSLLPVYSEEEGSDRYGGAKCGSPELEVFSGQSLP